MDPAALMPAADPIPAAPWIFRSLLDLTFAVHLLFMNAMFGLTLLCFVRSLRGSPGIGRQAALVPNATALAVNIGVAPLLFLQVLYGQFLYVSSTLMGVYWFVLVLAVMAAYGLAYRQKYALARSERRATLAWGVMSALMLYAVLTQTSNAVLLIRPELWTGFLDKPSGTLTGWGDQTFIPRALHFVAASLAMGGLALAMTGLKRAKKGDPEGRTLVAEGLGWFGWATLVQAVDGVWFLVSLPRPAMLAFMGGDQLATGLLIAGLAGAGTAVALAFKGRLKAAAAAGVATVGIMVGVRDVLRQLYLARYFDPESLPVRPEPSTLVMFLAALALSLAAVAWAAKRPETDPKGA